MKKSVRRLIFAVMSERDLQRIEVLVWILDGNMHTRTAAGLLGLSLRQIQRLIGAVRIEGAMAVRHKRTKAAKLATNEALRQYVQERLSGHISYPHGSAVVGPATL